MQRREPTRKLEIVLRSPTPEMDRRPEMVAPAGKHSSQGKRSLYFQDDGGESPREAHNQHGNNFGRADGGNHAQNVSNVYVAGIPGKCTEDNLRKIFSKFGSIVSVNVIKDHQTGNSRRFAYLKFAKGEDAQAAIAEMDGTSPFNEHHTIKVELAKHDKQTDGGHDYQPNGGHRGFNGRGDGRRFNDYERNDYHQGGDNH
jgi:RNA recognition motif-containing protein